MNGEEEIMKTIDLLVHDNDPNLLILRFGVVVRKGAKEATCKMQYNED